MYFFNDWPYIIIIYSRIKICFFKSKQRKFREMASLDDGADMCGL